MSNSTLAPTTRPIWVRLTPVVFVLLWSTGFIGAKFGLPYAEPLTFLMIRLGMVAAVLAVVALVTAAPWPSRWIDAAHIMVAGLLVHGIYLGGVFTGIAHGLPAGVVALIVGLQPLLTAAASGKVLGESVSTRQWLGLTLGLCGVLLVVWESLSVRADFLIGIALCLGALAGITAGTLYQKRFCGGMDLRSGTALQYAATSVVLLALAWNIETMEVDWTGEFVFALMWLGFVLSVGAVFLLFILIRRGAAAEVASLFYLTPPVTAVIAWLMFDERLGALALVGMMVTAAGVALVNNRKRAT
ncbi:peptide ABC transporter ATP-binding protein [Skermanella stibiiresistens SB22]|uniref:Peptide ABC transporter ATP-binding protein n=1 Tax=Skermanella stibiiresistens SB22 TaxID=1385369 RepID=W9H206_9PROT|nr:DMT family transporter [Skermanella stibiiresistens]EWY38851.1 peptide ABC transporter ATP-binding protein [Skermanella stibiiresistens SB22]